MRRLIHPLVMVGAIALGTATAWAQEATAQAAMPWTALSSAPISKDSTSVKPGGDIVNSIAEIAAKAENKIADIAKNYHAKR